MLHEEPIGDAARIVRGGCVAVAYNAIEFRRRDRGERFDLGVGAIGERRDGGIEKEREPVDFAGVDEARIGGEIEQQRRAVVAFVRMQRKRAGFG